MLSLGSIATSSFNFFSTTTTTTFFKKTSKKLIRIPTQFFRTNNKKSRRHVQRFDPAECIGEEALYRETPQFTLVAVISYIFQLGISFLKFTFSYLGVTCCEFFSHFILFLVLLFGFGLSVIILSPAQDYSTVDPHSGINLLRFRLFLLTIEIDKHCVASFESNRRLVRID